MLFKNTTDYQIGVGKKTARGGEEIDLNEKELAMDSVKELIKDKSFVDAKAEVKKPEPKVEAKKPEPKVEVKKPEIKVEAKKPEIKVEVTKEEIKVGEVPVSVKIEVSKVDSKI